jgi:Tfp pilus assembly PilM family ATPase/Tfp pilus assembly protein PilN
MRLKERPLLGIDIHEGELRVAAVVERNGNAVLQAVGYTKIPAQALKAGMVVDPGAVSVALKRLLDTKGLAGCRDVVIGVPSGGTVVRTIQVPPVPDEEMPAIVAGEVEHYGIVAAGGSHAFLKLHAPSKSPADLVSLVVAGASANLVTSVGDLARRTELDITSLEPVEFAMIRMALASLGPTPTALVVAIGENTTTLSFVCNGQLWAYRQLESGAHAFLHRQRNGPNEEIDRAAVLACSKEIRRTIEYLSRTHPQEATLEKIHVVTSDAALLPVPLMLSEFLERPVQLHTPSESVSASASVKAEIAGEAGIRYSAAVGLGERGVRSAINIAPVVDLYASERSAAKADVQRRTTLLTYMVAAAIGLIGVIAMIVLQSQISAAANMADNLRAQASSIRQSSNVALTGRAEELKRYRLLRAEGVPVVALLDFMTPILPASVGLSEVSVDTTKIVRISGESNDEQSVMELLRSLQNVPVITNPHLDSMRNDSDKGGITFTIVGSMVGMDRVKVPKREVQP